MNVYEVQMRGGLLDTDNPSHIHYVTAASEECARRKAALKFIVPYKRVVAYRIASAESIDDTTTTDANRGDG